MKKGVALVMAMIALLALACGNSTTVELQPGQDSIIADTATLDTNKIGSANTDTPALGTDNIRMDSMNNNK
ncbi:hypothetical protein [Pedobacter nanyangensis]|uniref:hypothetical protein n=1 Tax=Pedobacter nanyangensis TaxID=1562389 RepID=UPI0013B3CA0E|nr:hypothetical protein [Pedobacter nanyangensis]